jgi:hydrogenase maturation protease
MLRVMSKVMLIGYGNPMRSDDGLGWYVADLLMRYGPDRDVEIRTCHQLTPELAEPISQADFVVFVDAHIGLTPGLITSTYVEPTSVLEIPSTHHLTPPALLGLTKHLFGQCPEAIVMSIAGQSFELGTALSDAVLAAIPQFLEYVGAAIWRVQGARQHA